MPATRILIAALFISCLHSDAFSQKKFFSGTIRDSASLQLISRASIRNLNNGFVVISKLDGSFLIEAGQGQVLSFAANGYYSDTVIVSPELWNIALLSITLRPIPATLADVVVTGTYNPYQRDSITRRREFLQTIGDNEVPVVGRANDLGFGIAINIDHFSKAEKRRRGARTIFDLMEEEAYINYRWNDILVAKYTRLEGEALIDFMQDHRPGYEWLRNHPDEEALVYYINDRLKKEKRKK